MAEASDAPPARPEFLPNDSSASLRDRQLDGKPYSRMVYHMKTTIDIPESLYRRAKIHAVETGRTLKDLVLTSLEKELDPVSPAEPEKTTWANRKLRPDFEAALKAGAFSGGTDSTVMISEDRSSREDALL
jgi:hypothetical protein